jgi:tRNA-splicing ligase RtcB
VALRYIDNLENNGDAFAVWGDVDDNTLEQAKMCRRSADHLALMADNHLGYGVPIGGVIAWENKVSPTAVGFDIGCGNKAVRLDVPAAYVRNNISKIMDEVWKTLSFGVGRKNNEPVQEFDALESHLGWGTEAARPLRDKAAAQLGTIGSGNHYVDIFTDELDRVWVGVHFGSRGFGHGIATWFLERAGAKDGMMVEPVTFDTGSELGFSYVAAMDLAGKYAYAGRDWVCERRARLLGNAVILEEVHNHHNFAWYEVHFGKGMWVHRKGATSAFPGQRGFVGGTMADPAVILEGRSIVVSADVPQSVQAMTEQRIGMYSTVHGAGRVMGRKEATGVTKKNKETGVIRVVREPRVTQEMMDARVRSAHVELRGAGVDESPQCYKRLSEVLHAHSKTVDILHVLTPVGVAMAGKNEHDPFKD